MQKFIKKVLTKGILRNSFWVCFLKCLWVLAKRLFLDYFLKVIINSLQIGVLRWVLRGAFHGAIVIILLATTTSTKKFNITIIIVLSIMIMFTIIHR